MNCDTALELISAKLDGELTDREAVGLEEHLAACPGCRALAADLGGIHDALGGLELIEPPVGLTDGVLRQISAGKVRPLASWRRWGAIAAAFALVLLGSFGVLRSVLPFGGSDEPASADMIATADAGMEPSAASPEAPAGAAPESAPEYGAVSGGGDSSEPVKSTERAAAAPDEDAAMEAENGIAAMSDEDDVTDGAAADHTAEYSGALFSITSGASQPEASQKNAVEGGLLYGELTVAVPLPQLTGGVADGAGMVYHYLAAEDFDALVAELEAQGVAYALRVEGEDISSDAGEGLVICPEG